MRWFWGKSRLGKISIPPKPARFLLVDQLTGILYALKANATEDGVDLVVSQAPPRAPGVGATLDFRTVSDSGFEIYVFGAALLARAIGDESIRYDGQPALIWSGRKVYEIDVESDGTITLIKISG